MTDPLQNFDDPELKAAIGELRRDGRASEELRARVRRSLSESQPTEGESRTQPISQPSDSPADRVIRWRPGFRSWLAVAACVLLTVGGIWGYRYHSHRVQQDREAYEEYARSTALMGAMVAIHDIGRGSASGLQPLASPLSDARALSTEASAKLDRTVPIVDLMGRGWTLDAADFCMIGTVRSVRFRFTRGPQSVSVLSVPVSMYGTDGDHYEKLIAGHPIAGYARNGSMTCVVGDPASRLVDTVGLRDAIRDQ